MKITTREVLQWDKQLNAYVTLESESFEYEGPVAEMKGGSSAPANTTSTTKPFPEQLGYVKEIFARAQQDSLQPKTFYPGQTVAPQNQNQLDADQMQLDAAGNMQGLLGTANTAWQNALGPIDVQNDPTVMGYADAATNPMINQFQRDVMPGIGSSANQAGAFGGSRQGLVEANAMQNLSDSVGNARAGIFNNAYGQQLNQQTQAMGMSGMMGSLQSLPAQMTSEVGANQQSYQQALIDAARERHDFQQNEQGMRLNQYSNLINQFGGGQTLSTGMGGQSPSRFSSALGGAAAGASIGTMFGGPGIGTAIGGAAGLFGLI